MVPGRAVELNLEDAVEFTRTGDLWLFRGSTAADRAIRTMTNAPVNHVGMAVVIDDLPPLLWHAELGRSLPDMWTGKHQRGVQLHDLRDAVTLWNTKYRASGWLRQLSPEAGPTMQDAVLRAVARWDGAPFPSTLRLARSWVLGRFRQHRPTDTVYCAEVVAATYQEMGLLPSRRPTNWYDPGRFWSGDGLELLDGASLGPEIAVRPAAG